ncbi:hypothetical protein HYW82_01515 [Candidatus Peregrinibacteria bacterium]|nr:hypothetical protein [Candidatus Peregrinibacteria bacterium]
MSNGLCAVCRWVAPFILLATAGLLLLVNLEVLTGSFATFVGSWWPLGIGLYALAGFCPCHSCKME